MKAKPHACPDVIDFNVLGQEVGASMPEFKAGFEVTVRGAKI